MKHIIIEIIGERSGCKLKDRLEVRVEIITCHCVNGGECVRGVNQEPACVCPPGFTGEELVQTS